jgi:hypothetical protein
MLKRSITFSLTIILVMAIGFSAKAAPTAANYVRKFKPLTLNPTLTMPSAKAVKEIGGIMYGKHIDLKLKDGSTVRCFPEATKDPAKTSKNYYYLPGNPKISRDPDGTPKFSLIRFVTDKTKLSCIFSLSMALQNNNNRKLQNS